MDIEKNDLQNLSKRKLSNFANPMDDTSNQGEDRHEELDINIDI